ncbi:SCP2 sterol-binding domain-containing protein [Azospirillum sp.]|uniref:SCP2 sterol-binding domain-containing protein n=1 Tax=Azospirillum sp. TaxID=34012 RepID=UPI002D28C557|nr:SCP2 sterol-binding domain-containing protein [Azospirillum sp.]HYD66867.1 SCP2 sterol-binding domain-containing protein [Azospirillum sp.]
MVDDLVSTIQSRSGDLRGLGAKVRFALGGPGDMILVDARANPVTVTRADANGSSDADCTIRMTPENLNKLINGQLNPMLAFTMGKLKVEGSMGVALKLASLLEA